MRISRSCTAAFGVVVWERGAYMLHRKTTSKGVGKERKTMLLAIVRFLQDYREFNRNLRELSRLDDRELADIGITRADIPRVAAAGLGR